MARIRTVKPDFFRHELLQDLELTHQGKHPMLVFAGLWGHCDKAGRFEWRPRTLKLDILPFIPFDMEETLGILEQAQMVRRYTVGGVEYGEIPTFIKHQRIGGKEASEPEKFPGPSSEAKGKKRGSTGEAPGKQSGSTGEAPGIAGREGKGRELGKEGNGVRARARATSLPDNFGISERVKAWAGGKGFAQLERYLEFFVSKAKAKGYTYVDWDEAFMGCVREDWPGLRNGAQVIDYDALARKVG